MADRPHGRHRSVQPNVSRQLARLDNPQHPGRGTQFEIGRDLRQVGIAGDHVQSAMPARVGVRLVAGVDDRPVERGLQPNLSLEEIRALADLEAGSLAGLTHAYSTGSGDHLPRDEKAVNCVTIRSKGVLRCSR